MPRNSESIIAINHAGRRRLLSLDKATETENKENNNGWTIDDDDTEDPRSACRA
jgi:hypothetical protein